MTILKKLLCCLRFLAGYLLIINFFLPSLLYANKSVPSLLINKPVYDFGQTEKGTIITHDFPIMNTGDKPLLIKRVKGG